MRETEERPETRAGGAGRGAPDPLQLSSREATPGGARARHPLVELTLTRMREFTREREAVFWGFMFPVLLSAALGIAFRNTGPEKVHVAVEVGGAGGATLAEALRRSDDLEVLTLPPEEARQALRSGRVALVVRPGDPAAGGAAQGFEYRFDPTRPESRAARLAADDALQRAAGRADVARASDVKVTEPGARYIDFLIPGLLGLNLMGNGVWGVGFAIVTARMRKLLKRLSATPMRRTHYLASFAIWRAIFLVLEVTLVLVFVRLVFGYEPRGSYVSMSLILLLGAFAFAAVGLLIATRSETIEGVSGLMNLVMVPMWLFSGTFFSSERFPAFFQPFIKALPLTAVNDALRSVMNDGAPLAASWPALAVLCAWCVGSFAVALKLFRWQ